jgi:hypothetical protein
VHPVIGFQVFPKFPSASVSHSILLVDIGLFSFKKTQDVIEWMDKKGIEPNPALYERMILAECGFYG